MTNSFCFSLLAPCVPALCLLRKHRVITRRRWKKREKKGRFYQFAAIPCPAVTRRNWREKHSKKFYWVLVIPCPIVQVNLTERPQTCFSRVNSCCFLAHGIMQFNETSGFKPVNFGVLLCYQSVQLLGHVWIFAIPWTATCQASQSITNSQSLLKLMSIESVMSSNHLILCWPLLLLPSVFPSIRVFSNELVLRISWLKYWSFSFSIRTFNEYSGIISFRIDWLDLLAVQKTQESPPTPQFKSINSSLLSLLHSPTLTSLRNYWKNHSLE